MDKRSESVDSKIQKLDKELMRYTEQMKKMKPGPAKESVNRDLRALLNMIDFFLFFFFRCTKKKLN